jgi:HlyD family secretion protein
MKKKLIPVIVVLVLAAIAVIVGVNRHREFLYAGTVEATELDISSRLSGVIDTIDAREGDEIKKGTLLIKLSSEDIVVAAEAAERDYRRGLELVKAGSMDQGSFDKVRFKYDDARVKSSWITTLAPVDATVISRFHEPGELVVPGTKILRMAELDKVWVYVYVPQPLLGKLSVGMKADGRVSDSDMKKITGMIIKINNEAEFTPKNVQTKKERTRLVYGIKVEFDNKDRYLKPGMTVEVKLSE